MWHTKNHKNVHSANPSKSSTYIMFGFIMFPFFGLILCLSFISTIDTLMRYSNHVNHKTKIKGDNIIVEFLLYLVIGYSLKAKQFTFTKALSNKLQLGTETFWRDYRKNNWHS